MIKLNNLKKSYWLGDEEVVVVKRINLEIKEGEYVSVLGPSGCGKSTLMYMLGLLEIPTSGNIYIDGRDVSKLDDDELSKVRNEKIGFVFQSFNLINKLTILENVLMPASYYKGEKKMEFENRANELLKRFGIYERRNFYPNKISGGQQQRTAIARALIMNPSVILADEPTGNLDTKTGNEILSLLDELNKELKVTIVMVTHEPDVARRTKRQIVMSDGLVVSETRNGNKKK